MKKVHYIDNKRKVVAVLESGPGITITLNDETLTVVELPEGADKKALDDRLTKEEVNRYAKDKQK